MPAGRDSDEFETSSTETINCTAPDSKIRFLTWANSAQDRRVRLLTASARQVGITVAIAECHSLSDKPASLRRTISDFPPSDLVVCTDGFDVLYLRDEEAIRNRWMEFETPVVFGGERFPIHHFQETEAHFREVGEGHLYPFLNSGLLMGEVSAVSGMLDSISTYPYEEMENRFLQQSESEFRGHYNDQTLFGCFAAEYPDIVGVDHDGHLFWNTSRECQRINDLLGRDATGLVNRASGTGPALIHIPYLNRYYPTYLQFANELGIHLGSKNLDFERWDASLAEAMVPIRPPIRRKVESTFGYRRRIAAARSRVFLQNTRKRIGKYRRKILQQPLP